MTQIEIQSNHRIFVQPIDQKYNLKVIQEEDGKDDDSDDGNDNESDYHNLEASIERNMEFDTPKLRSTNHSDSLKNMNRIKMDEILEFPFRDKINALKKVLIGFLKGKLREKISKFKYYLKSRLIADIKISELFGIQLNGINKSGYFSDYNNKINWHNNWIYKFKKDGVEEVKDGDTQVDEHIHNSDLSTTQVDSPDSGIENNEFKDKCIDNTNINPQITTKGYKILNHLMKNSEKDSLFVSGIFEK